MEVIIELFLESANLVDVNIVKFILSWIAMGFDGIFMF
jgi:cystinosin